MIFSGFVVRKAFTGILTWSGILFGFRSVIYAPRPRNSWDARNACNSNYIHSAKIKSHKIPSTASKPLPILVLYSVELISFAEHFRPQIAAFLDHRPFLLPIPQQQHKNSVRIDTIQICEFSPVLLIPEVQVRSKPIEALHNASCVAGKSTALLNEEFS